MYLRVKKNKTSFVLQLIQSVWRKGGTPQQKIIASFGGLNLPKELFKEVSKDLSNYFSEMPLSDDNVNPEARLWAEKLISIYNRRLFAAAKTTKPVSSIVNGVRIDEIESSNFRMLGPLLPLEKAWNDLDLDAFLKANGFTQRNINSLKVCVYNRLLEPVSEHGLVKWVGTTAFEDISGCMEVRDESHYYRVGDKLFKISDKLEKHLHARECALLPLENAIWLYDLTNSYFEGNCMKNPRAKRSVNSKEKRTDCPLLSLGLVLDKAGFPICHRVFDGSNNDCRSIPEIIEYLQKCSGLDDKNPPTIVMDGGIATEKNLDLLVKKGFNYIVNGKRTTRDNFYEDFIDDGSFHMVTGRDDKKPVMVSKTIKGNEIVILCKSASRKQKEDAIVSKTEEHLLEELQKLTKRVEKNDKKLKLEAGDQLINQKIGAIKNHYTRASKYYEISYDGKNKKLNYKRNDESYLRDSALHGCYQLRTNRTDLTDEQIWYTYIMLTRIERSFRSMKSDLGLRPFYHQKDDRCETHVLFTVFAYHLQRYIEYRLSEKNYDATFLAVRRLLQTHCYVTTEVPTTKGTILVRKPGKPDPVQAALYRVLDIDTMSLPRMKRMVAKGDSNITH